MALIEARSVEETFRRLKALIGEQHTDAEILRKAELAVEVNRLKEQRGAVILGHNYMGPALFLTVPDYTGDSFALCQRAAETDKDPIVFCGVKFMAETAKIINPDRTVLLPSLEAGCSLAASITGEDVRRLRDRYPGVPVVTYINTYADVKAQTDICCTSGNAAKIVESLDADVVLFLPDEYLARNVAKETGRRFVLAGPGDFPEVKRAPGERILIGWNGRCEVHELFTVADIETVRAQYPDVVILAHPECSPEVVGASDFSGSTKAMIAYVRENDAPRFLLLTECSMGDNIVAQNPDKNLLRLCSQRCPHMKTITLQDTLTALRENRHVIELPPDLIAQARRAVDRMLELG